MASPARIASASSWKAGDGESLTSPTISSTKSRNMSLKSPGCSEMLWTNLMRRASPVAHTRRTKSSKPPSSQNSAAVRSQSARLMATAISSWGTYRSSQPSIRSRSLEMTPP
eukprot:Amastigsp_a175183_15.p5 type:complete len:112 gc:universal Amastigsp_a175183_15:1716-1381(-)